MVQGNVFLLVHLGWLDATVSHYLSLLSRMSVPSSSGELAEVINMSVDEHITFNPPDNIEDMIKNVSESGDGEEEVQETAC